MDVYNALADTYEAMGDTEGLRRILAQGIKATGDAALKERLANQPIQVPQLPEIWEGLNTYYSEISYVPVDEELESIVAEAIEAGLAGNREILEDATWNAQWAERICTYLKESGIELMNRVYESDEATEYNFWTQLSDGSILRYQYVDKTDYVWYTIVYRTEEENGFYSELWIYPDGDISYWLTQGEFSGWLFNGSYESIRYRSGSDDAGNLYEDTVQITGTAIDDLCDGGEWCVTDYETIYREYKAGKEQVIWTDESGDGFTTMRVDETGEVEYTDVYSDSSTKISYPWRTTW